MITKMQKDQLEKQIIASCLYHDDRAMEEVVNFKVDSSWFNSENNLKVWNEITRLHNEGLEIKPQAIRGIDSNQLIAFVERTDAGILNIREYIEQLDTVIKFGKLEAKTLELRKYQETGDIKAAIGEMSSLLDEMQETGSDSAIVDTDDVLAEVEEFYELDEDLGLKAGFKQIDTAATYENGELTIVAARPAMGKTAFSLGLSRNWLNAGKSGVIFSLEMPAQQLFFRMMAAEAKIPLKELREDKVKYNIKRLRATYTKDKSVLDAKQLAFIKALGKWKSWNLTVIDKSGLRVSDIKSMTRKLHKQGKVDFVMIDYLTYIQGDGKYQSKHHEVGDISKNLKFLAKEINKPVICLAQLSRAVEQRPDRRPIMSDLKESGDIEQDAALIQFLYRDEYYNEDSDYKGWCEVITAKNRNGETGKGVVKFYGSTQLFCD